MKPPKGSHKLRSGRVSIENQAYFITTATHERIPYEIVLYMLNNPVRAGLVEDFHDYPFWYCRWSV
jgi:hypothetical protein